MRSTWGGTPPSSNKLSDGHPNRGEGTASEAYRGDRQSAKTEVQEASQTPNMAPTGAEIRAALAGANLGLVGASWGSIWLVQVLSVLGIILRVDFVRFPKYFVRCVFAVLGGPAAPASTRLAARIIPPTLHLAADGVRGREHPPTGGLGARGPQNTPLFLKLSRPTPWRRDRAVPSPDRSADLLDRLGLLRVSRRPDTL